MSRFQSTNSRNGQNQLPILMCHDISDQRAVTALAPAVFRSGLARLHAAGFHTVRLEDVAECLRPSGRTSSGQAETNAPRSFPTNAFALTFDDGWESVCSQAFPVLQQHGFSATVFLTVGDRPVTTSQARLPSRPGRTMLSWGQIREMQRYGIADALGVAVPTFAYPYGYYDNRTRDIVRQHFVCACSVRLGLVTAASDPYALERVDTHYLRTERLFALMLSPWFPWYVRARAIPRHIRRRLGWRIG
jgi:peptidoglycan/xylan/chitin deacetylase (PgdA/CDA1 family)